jgi:anti-sigma factor RsiW
MTSDTSPVVLEDLSAYLDGELDAPRREAVERHLAAHPDAAARLDGYRRRDEALRLAFAEIAGAGNGHRRLDRLSARPAGWRRWAVAAAALLCVGMGAAAWWLAAQHADDRRVLAGLRQEALTAHLLYEHRTDSLPAAPDGHRRLAARLSALVGPTVRLPDLAALGFRLDGMRELAAAGSPAALLVYRDAGGRHVSCYFRRVARDRDTGFDRYEGADANVVLRVDDGVAYAVVGALAPAMLQQIAALAYQEGAASR